MGLFLFRPQGLQSLRCVPTQTSVTLHSVMGLSLQTARASVTSLCRSTDICPSRTKQYCPSAVFHDGPLSLSPDPKRLSHYTVLQRRPVPSQPQSASHHQLPPLHGSSSKSSLPSHHCLVGGSTGCCSLSHLSGPQDTAASLQCVQLPSSVCRFFVGIQSLPTTSSPLLMALHQQCRWQVLFFKSIRIKVAPVCQESPYGLYPAAP